MATQITLPHLGENIESGDVLSIFVAEGDVISAEQDLIEVETDKATMPIPSPQAGKVAKILVSEGDTIAVGAPILEIDAAEAAPLAATPPAPPAQEEPIPAPAAAPTQAAKPIPPAPEDSIPTIVEPELEQAPPVSATALQEQPEIPATAGDGHAAAAAAPSVRRLARELGVELRRVRPSNGNRITEEDVRAYIRQSNVEAAEARPKGVTPPGVADSDSRGAVRREKMSRLRQTIARNMFASYSTIPQLTNFDDVDLTELERIRKDSKDDYATQGVKLTSMPFLVKAIAAALRQHPVLNASVSESGEEVIYKEYVNVGIAVDTERGLIVPVLRDADRKSIPQIAKELANMAESARAGSFAIEDLRGGTFTISNLGAVGGTYSTPIINPPEVAILLAGRSRTLPMYVNGQLEPRLMLPLSLTYDHRVVDGAAAARFLNDVKKYLANPGRLLLAP